MGPEVSPRYVYRIDARDFITFVSPQWIAFARDNDAAHLALRSPLGESLWRFIDGEATRDLYHVLFQRVRTQSRPITIPFRCDSPSVRRFMGLTMSPLPDDGIELCGSLLRHERRQRVDILNSAVKRSDQWLTVCSWCKRAHVPEFGWVEIEEAIVCLNVSNSPVLPNLTGGICSDCRRRIEGELYGKGGARLH
jgi:hypothetical protein